MKYIDKKTEKRLIVDFVVPGVAPEDIKVTTFNDSENGCKVEVKAEVKESISENRNSGFYGENKGKLKESYEISDSRFDLEQAKVSFFNGIVRVSIPKFDWAIGNVIHPSEMSSE